MQLKALFYRSMVILTVLFSLGCQTPFADLAQRRNNSNGDPSGGLIEINDHWRVYDESRKMANDEMEMYCSGHYVVRRETSMFIDFQCK